MRPEHVPYGHIELLRVRTNLDAMPSSVVPGAPVRLRYSDREAQALLRVGADVLAIEGDDKRNDLLLTDLCTQNLPRLAWVVDLAPRVITLQVHIFAQALLLPPIEVGVDEKIFETMARIDRKLAAPDRALAWLTDELVVPGDGEGHGFATVDDRQRGSFALSGAHVRAFIQRVTRADRSEVLRVDKLVRGRARGGEPLSLLSGQLRFVDATVAGKLRAEAAAQLSSLVASGESFLQIWRRYGELENEATLRRARRAKWLTYKHAESLGNGQYRFTLEPACTFDDAENFARVLGEEQGLSVEAVAQVPEVITTDMPYEAFAALAEGTPAATFGARIERLQREHAVILTQHRDDEREPPDAGALVVSLAGDKTRLKRRDEADRILRSGQGPMPQLQYLLEGLPVAVARRGNLQPITPSVRRKVFGERSPTPTQEEALRVALNTPDIALIQGPPGTGKTTVIIALVERLQEIWDTSGGVQGKLLLSGFQHDAVENAIQRMSVNGLPPIKFGRRANNRDDAERVDETIARWCKERSEAIHAHLPPRPISKLQDEIAELTQGYLLAPGTLDQTAALLDRIAHDAIRELPAALTTRLRELARALADRARSAREGDPVRAPLVRCVRALRCEPASFADDGPRQASHLASALADAHRLDDDTRALLDTAARWTGDAPPPFLDALGALRRRLLLAVLPAGRLEHAVPHVRTDVLDVLREVRDHLARRHAATRDAADEATWTFLTALEEDPEAVKRAVISYTSVFAATCQQSASRELAAYKGSDGYDTVVVDEAARANPLDLFIPLAKARRRIILVGDHRQLPHILDSEIERQLEAANEGAAEQRVNEALQESLFERLFRDLRRREAQDGIRRTVTLDEQYRMHPALGQLVSDQFYAVHGEAFRSPRPASEFTHALPGVRGPAAWLRVPRRLGGEDRGQSKARPVEARALVAELKQLMDAPGGRALTFGVIAFYKKQVAAIEDALERAGMLARSGTDGAEIVPPYRECRLDSGRVAERLRVGTVDAFQGMEFDVVFLSLVRSNDRGVFGHVTHPNRLCVAMSRQKRLLIVVGDDDMLRARTAPHALTAFHQLSEVRDAARV